MMSFFYPYTWVTFQVILFFTLKALLFMSARIETETFFLETETVYFSRSLRPCPHVGNFNFAIWRQRDKEMFFCKKKLPTQKNVQHSSAIFFSHRCQQCFLNLKVCQIVFKSFMQYFSPKTYLAHGF